MSVLDYLPSIGEFLKMFSGELLLLAALFVLRIIGIDTFIKAIKIYNFFSLSILKYIFRRSVLIVYTDANDNGNSTISLCSRITSALNDVKAKTIPLKASEDLLKWPMLPSLLSSIVVILTDVTSLSSNKSKREKIQNSMSKYAIHGGILVLGHDVLYRRSRNDILSKLCGVTLTKFFPYEDCVKYIKNKTLIQDRTTTNSTLMESLPDTLELDDRECVTGEWGSHIEYLYVSNDAKQIPLVTRQEVGNGVVFWINSGDHTENGPPPSLAKPADDLVNLLTVIIRFGKNKSP